MKWNVVVPTNRPEKFVEFMGAWGELFKRHRVTLYIVEDAPEVSSIVCSALEGYNYVLLCQKDVPDFIPKKTDMIRSYAFYLVWKNCEYPPKVANEYVLTLDDDTKPVGDVFAEYQKVFEKGSVSSEFFSVGSLTTSGLEMRGFPYVDRKKQPVAVQYGGWNGVLDYDAATQLAVPKLHESFARVVVPVPRGAAATCCIMNCAFAVEYAPIMWQLPMLDGRYNRVGDIWSGLFIKKTLDAINDVMVINGRALVVHDRASDPYNSLQKEAPSVKINDELWYSLATPNTVDMLQAYREVTDSAAQKFSEYDKEYAEYFTECRDKWLSLYEAPMDNKTC